LQRTETDLPGLDEFYKYIEKQESGAKGGEKVARANGNGKAGAKPVRYVIRGGVTVAEPVDGQTNGSAATVVADGAGDELDGAVYVPATVGAGESANGDETGTTSEEALAMWRRLPRHIQLLASIAEPEGEEVARKYYTRDFKETRQQLIQRLLNPTLTLEETARVLGVCPATVRRYTNRGVLPHFRTIGQQRRFRLSDVLVFLERQEQQAGSGRRGRKRAEEVAA
jgi:excisionase family DNA binding protein